MKLARVLSISDRWMINCLQDKTVRCELTGEMNRDRRIGTCYVDGENLSARVIAAGHALDCARYLGEQV